jgi:hypothetical protein
LNSDLVTYYSNRAKEYEEIYFKPERQEELKKFLIKKMLSKLHVEPVTGQKKSRLPPNQFLQPI